MLSLTLFQWTGAGNERDILLNLMARYQAMETALQNIPGRSCVLDISTELTEIQGTVAQLNEQHKTERGRLSVRVGLKGLSKATKKQLKKELQGLGDRQKHLLQAVRRHKEVNSRLKQVLAGFNTTRTTCAGREFSEETQGGMGSIAVSKLAAVGSNMQGGVHDNPGRSQIIGEPTGVSRMEGGKCDNVQTSLDYTSAENGIVSESSFQKDYAPKEFLRDQNAWLGHTGAIEAQTSYVTDNVERKNESSGNNLNVVNQKYRDDNICENSMEHIYISKSIPTGVEDDSVITATGNELLVKGDVRRAPCSQVKETEACVRSDHRNSAGAGEASQISGIEDSQQDLFSQGSSDQDMDRRMVEEIIATQTLSQESDCPVVGDIRHVGGGVSLEKHGEVSGRQGADQGGVNNGKMEEDVTDRLIKGRMDREVDGKMDSQVGGKMDRQVDERIDGQADGRMDRGVAGRIDTQVDGKMDRQADGRIDGQADGWMNRGVAGRIDTQVDGKMDRQADERIDGQADGWMNRGVAGRINTQVDGKKDRPMDRNTGWQGGVSGDRQNDVKLDRKTDVDVGERNSSATSSGPINQHMDNKISNSVGSKTGEKANVSFEVEKDSTEKPVCVFGDQAESDNSGDGLGRKTMKRKREESMMLGYVGPSEGEAKKIKMGRCITGEMVGSVGSKPAVCQSRSDVANTQVMGVSIPHLEVQSSGRRDSEGEINEPKVASDRKTGFVLPGKQTVCNQVEGSLIPMSMKSKDRHSNKRQHEIVKENRSNSNNTAKTTYGQSLGNHCDKGIMSATVGDVGSLPSVITSLKASTVAPGPKEVMGLSPQERGTEKEKDMSLISPPHPQPMKNITTSPQKLQADNLPASAVLSPGSTVASSDVFPVSCRELVRRMVERDAREKQSRKDNDLLQKEAPSDYIAVPVGRIEDFSENLQLKDVDVDVDVDTQTPTFVQPQVPPAPRPVATSKMADITTLVENGVLTPGKGVLSVRAKGKVLRASLSSTGHIIGSGGEVYRTPKSWCQAVTGAVTVKKLQSYSMVLYKGHPLSSFVVPVESTESTGHKEIRTQTDCYGKPVVSSITRSLMTTDKSTSLPRQSSGVSSTTIAANKVRTRPLTHSSTKSLAKRTGTTPPMTSPAANRQTGITLPVPLPVTRTNKSSVANGEEMVAKGNKETSASMSELLRVLWKCTIKLIDDAEIVRCPEFDSTFWMTNFKDIRLSDSLWDSVDSWK